MTPKYRILKKEKGYIVEVEDIRWSLLGLKKKWKPFILETRYDFAMKSLLYEIEIETMKNANFKNI